ncbi:hypothetical protein PUNSTDRAFT_74149 [Punctularia strigosozonata HHB-11173 SS5]|uniref:uncharacterized protein n=1 Tax=Punctularia strigosozonata (strain HHB-11173) TaxID=741275 RepID=UPI00044184F3|nr:uncharacterized protein PUNSTDRAFT_74149 [Punctularia strigosozonata HHB-11173 SS5]EIN05875.1 hypothetical protein PUNSTDRAFT_74149 [Punctularia strigosozonata HHB-11173 SS5]
MIRGSTLQGMCIPRILEHTIVSLFADDTSVILHHLNRFEDLTAILDEWCATSGAKFNVLKTGVIPLGPAQYRAEVVTTCKLETSNDCIPEGIKIGSNGEAIHYLGAWIGNGADNAILWGPTLEKIDVVLGRWERSHPTLEGRHLIVQMVIGGMSQYLTKVQGMPAKIKKTLTKTIQTFIWNSPKAPPINKGMMTRPVLEEEKKILCLKERNKAIQLTWLQLYLNIGPTCPKWAYLADETMRKNVLKSLSNWDGSTLMNYFQQEWKPKTKGGSLTK